LRFEGERILYSEPIWIGQRIRDIAQLKNGAVVLWTDDAELQIVSVDREKLAKSKRWPESVDNVQGSIGDVLWQCMYCHHFGPTSPADFAPSLSNLFQRRIGSDNYRYTAALRDRGGGWTEETLTEFLSNPEKFANGTAMPSLALSQENIGNIVQSLKGVSDVAKTTEADAK
jgi:cytochrome c2